MNVLLHNLFYVFALITVVLMIASNLFLHQRMFGFAFLASIVACLFISALSTLFILSTVTSHLFFVSIVALVIALSVATIAIIVANISVLNLRVSNDSVLEKQTAYPVYWSSSVVFYFFIVLATAIRMSFTA